MINLTSLDLRTVAEALDQLASVSVNVQRIVINEYTIELLRLDSQTNGGSYVVTAVPHHAVIADGITVAVVPCADKCPPEHFYRAIRPEVTEMDDALREALQEDAKVDAAHLADEAADEARVLAELTDALTEAFDQVRVAFAHVAEVITRVAVEFREFSDALKREDEHDLG